LAWINDRGWDLSIRCDVDRNPDRRPEHNAKRGFNIPLLTFYHRLKRRRQHRNSRRLTIKGTQATFLIQ
jgi:hypothetical protein